MKTLHPNSRYFLFFAKSSPSKTLFCAPRNTRRGGAKKYIRNFSPSLMWAERKIGATPLSVLWFFLLQTPSPPSHLPDLLRKEKRRRKMCISGVTSCLLLTKQFVWGGKGRFRSLSHLFLPPPPKAKARVVWVSEDWHASIFFFSLFSRPRLCGPVSSKPTYVVSLQKFWPKF